MKQPKSYGTTLKLLVLVVVCCTISINLIPIHANPISSIEFNQAVDAAMYDVVSSSTFQQYVTNVIGFLVVPICPTKVEYPSRWPVSSSISELKMCYDGSSYIPQPWPQIYHEVGNRLMDALNKHYQMTMKAKFVPLVMNESLGYFENMKFAVESGQCDVAVADTTYTEERATKVKFSACPYGVTMNAFLRTDLDNTTLTGINELKHLNHSGINVTYYEGSVFETIAQENLQAATKFPTNYDNQYTLIRQRKVHAVIGDALDQVTWLENNKKECVGCYIRTFGLGGKFGVFTEATNRTSGSNSFHQRFPKCNGLQFLSVMILLMYVFVQAFEIL
ncbi:hypothetical protein C9374_005968 [Naegleria lovaniensis]|uniref:Solute-binding protein family 3/N-terminal domain-containing protein n=1 Tax=Naegleria lovaniensis TaxID=51637 RepID=A0AA88GIH1_NAELO|nr:uncharacterized protein C9374_005968 [Naegleria lovaniensis]KAG2381584.1 hypothetical protein C9374_005968 [Naegleria lovaniensis]